MGYHLYGAASVRPGREGVKREALRHQLLHLVRGIVIAIWLRLPKVRMGERL